MAFRRQRVLPPSHPRRLSRLPNNSVRNVPLNFEPFADRPTNFLSHQWIRHQGPSSRRWTRKGSVRHWFTRRCPQSQQACASHPVAHTTTIPTFIYSPEHAKELAKQMIGSNLITKQTGAGGRICNAVRVKFNPQPRVEANTFGSGHVG